MSIPNEALQKLLQEIEQKAAFSHQQIGVVKAQMAAKKRETRMLELTMAEVDSLPPQTNVYEGVGKMFVQSPTTEVQQRLAADSKELQSDQSNLAKKLHYLETTYKNSQDNLERVLRSGGG